MSEAVKVILRVRPLSQTETAQGNFSIITTDTNLCQISIQNPKTQSVKNFTYDAVYPQTCTQRSIYDESAFPLVESVIAGFNGTIFAYGQTGCGKTYTMLGGNDAESQGIIPNSFLHIFDAIEEANESTTFLVRCSYCEIYNEELRDLLNYNPNLKLELKEDGNKGIYVRNLSSLTVKSIQDIEQAMQQGSRHRITKGTNMNATSSRSHAIFTIYIETQEMIEGTDHFKAGKLNLVDLAGSERQKKTGAQGDRLKEAIEINLSLSALGNVISALVDGRSSHIPYRDSKLTRLLQDSLGGNTKTIMCAVVSPADYNYDESLSTLRYASRAKFIKNKPRINEDPKDALLRQYAEEINRLKQMIANSQNGEQVVIVEKIVEGPRNLAIGVQKGQNIQIQTAQTEQGFEEEEHYEDDWEDDSEIIRKQPVDDKSQLEQLLQQLEQKLISGGEHLNQIQANRLNEQRRYRKRIKKQRQREEELLQARMKKEEEILQNEQNFQSLQEEVTTKRKIIKKLRNKCKATQEEIQDINRENEIEREGLLETIRQREIDIQLHYKLLEKIISSKLLNKIKQKSRYDEDKQEWMLPKHKQQNQQSLCPKLPQMQARGNLTGNPSQSKFKGDNDFRSARYEEWHSEETTNGSQSGEQEQKLNRNVILNPLNKNYNKELDSMARVARNMTRRIRQQQINGRSYGE